MDLHVIVLGAGSTGLLIAQGLKKNGIRFSVYERESQHEYTNHQRDWSMAMLWGTEHIKSTLPVELLDRFDEIKADRFSSPTTTLPFSNGKTGDHLVDIPGGLAIRVNREKLRKFLSSDVEINFRKSSIKIEELGDKVVVTFTDGTTATADTVVCCDGIKGLGRTTLLGDRATLSTAPCTIVNIVNKYTPEQARFIYEALNPIKFASHPDQPTLFLLTPVDIPSLEHPEDWKLQCLLTTWGATHAETNAERVRIFKEAASNFAEPWRSAALWLPDDTFIPADGVRYWENPVAWPNWHGKLTLGGDAAHPMMPFRAQGLNNALADANQYVTSIVAVRDGQKPLSEAISQYGNEVFARGSKEIKLSGAWGAMLHDWNKLINMPLIKQGYGKQPASERQAPTPAVPKNQVSQTEPTPETATSVEPEKKAVATPLISTSDDPVPHATLEEVVESTASVPTLPAASPEIPRQPNTDPLTPSLTPTEEKKMSIPDFVTPSAALSPILALEKVQEAIDALKAMQVENEALRKRNAFLENKFRTINQLCMDGQTV